MENKQPYKERYYIFYDWRTGDQKSRFTIRKSLEGSLEMYWPFMGFENGKIIWLVSPSWTLLKKASAVFETKHQRNVIRSLKKTIPNIGKILVFPWDNNG